MDSGRGPDPQADCLAVDSGESTHKHIALMSGQATGPTSVSPEVGSGEPDSSCVGTKSGRGPEPQAVCLAVDSGESIYKHVALMSVRANPTAVVMAQSRVVDRTYNSHYSFVSLRTPSCAFVDPT
jgi:hypothetical protein